MMFGLNHENCSGCGTCRTVCALENFKQVNPSLALLKIQGRFPEPGDYRIHFCDQCGECAEACPVDAIELKSGAYVVNAEECTGCLSCVDACPNGVMFERKGSDAPVKCVSCGACAQICPRGAIVVLEDRDK